MRFIITILFITLFGHSFGQGLDTIQVSMSASSYVLLPSEVIRIEVGSKGFIGTYKENYVVLKATSENALPTSLMIQSKTGMDFKILKFVKNPTKIVNDYREIQNVQTVVAKTEQKNTITESNTSLKSVNPEVNNSAMTKGNIKTTPVIDKTPEKEQVGHISPEVYEKRNKERYGKEEAPVFISSRTSSGNRNVDVRDDIMQRKFYRMLKEKQSIKDVGEGVNGIYFLLADIFVDREFMYFKFIINNTSSISFDMDYMSLERAQGKTLKRKEALSNSFLEIVHYESVYSVAPGSEEVIIAAVNLFALNDNDLLKVKLNEQGGVRTLKLDVKAKLITNAKTL